LSAQFAPQHFLRNVGAWLVGVQAPTMLLNGVSVGGIEGRRHRLIDPPGPGFVRLTAISAKARRTQW
jgi:hypothetical protein